MRLTSFYYFLAAAAFAPVQPAAAQSATAQAATTQSPAAALREEPVAVGDYSYDDFYSGFRVSRLIGLPVIGAEGKRVGKIADVTIGFPGELSWVMVEPGAAASSMKGGRFSVGWEQLEVREDFSSAEILLSADNLQNTVPGQPIGPVERTETVGNQWHASELVGSKLEIDGDVQVGAVDDIVVGSDDRVKAVVFRDADAGKLRAVPWRSVVVEPGGDRMTVPLTKPVIARLPTFDYGEMAEIIPD
jgi:sporulation protein YlmC with PRC-barrel domain